MTHYMYKTEFFFLIKYASFIKCMVISMSGQVKEQQKDKFYKYRYNPLEILIHIMNLKVRNMCKILTIHLTANKGYF